MKVVHKNHLGINENTGTVHVDDWNGHSSHMNYIIFCGRYSNNYVLLQKSHLDGNIHLCKICIKLALKKKRCLVSTIALLKLKGI